MSLFHKKRAADIGLRRTLGWGSGPPAPNWGGPWPRCSRPQTLPGHCHTAPVGREPAAAGVTCTCACTTRPLACCDVCRAGQGDMTLYWGEGGEQGMFVRTWIWKQSQDLMELRPQSAHHGPESGLRLELERTRGPQVWRCLQLTLGGGGLVRVIMHSPPPPTSEACRREGAGQGGAGTWGRELLAGEAAGWDSQGTTTRSAVSLLSGGWGCPQCGDRAHTDLADTCWYREGAGWLMWAGPLGWWAAGGQERWHRCRRCFWEERRVWWLL